MIFRVLVRMALFAVDFVCIVVYLLLLLLGFFFVEKVE